MLCLLGRTLGGPFRFATRSCSSSTPYLGDVTPITASLWNDRLSAGSTEKECRESTPAPRAPHPTHVQYPFASEPSLAQRYCNPWGFVRLGKLLEDLDSLAGNIAFTHCDDGDPATRAPLLVTASVDSIALAKRLALTADLSMAGQVIWTGSSSLAIRMVLHQHQRQDTSESSPERDAPSLTAIFTFVARDPTTQRAMMINPLRPETHEQAAWFEERQRVSDARKAARRQAPSERAEGLAEPRRWAEGLLQEALTLQRLPALARGDAVLMADTQLENTFTCQPENKNMGGRVFGGFLMRRAFELAFSTAYMFAGSRPIFSEVGEVTFRSPVDVGDLLSLHSRILHADDAGRMHLEVIASVTQPEHVCSAVTNTFLFVFGSEGGDAPGRRLKRVLPGNRGDCEAIMRFYRDPSAHDD